MTTDFTKTHDASGRFIGLCVWGTTSNNSLSVDGSFPPFVIYHVGTGQIVDAPYHSKTSAEGVVSSRIAGTYNIPLNNNQAELVKAQISDPVLPAGRYSIFVLKDDNTWDQPTYKTIRPMLESTFRALVEERCSGFTSYGVQEDTECDSRDAALLDDLKN
jgi:hypothetical protein